jgi:hypothetical protein
MLKKNTKLKSSFTTEGSPNNAMTKKKSITKESIMSQIAPAHAQSPTKSIKDQIKENGDP